MTRSDTLKQLAGTAFAILAATTSVQALDNVVYDHCNITEYYATYGLTGDPTTWQKKDIFLALKNSHRNTIPYTNIFSSGSEDVWAALIDIERVTPGAENISLLYSDEVVPSLPFGTRFWVKEHVFPIDKGVGRSGPDYSDLHNLKAARQLSRRVRDDKYFGACRVLVRPDTCVSPAEGGADDTCSCNRLYEPPDSKKGEIARALMYMDVRYDGSDPDTLDLVLTDCPFDPVTDMAYLSQMLTWDAQYPVTEAEKFRNQRVCEAWQGNRNPFIDFPELARSLFGLPKPLPAEGERLIYRECEDVTTEPPTFSPNECETLNFGDFGIFLFNSQDPDSIAMYNFVEIRQNFELFVTDRAWDGSDFQETDNDQDGTLSMIVSDRFLPPGTFFGIGPNMPMNETWKPQSGTFSLSAQGEQIHIYCEMANGMPKPLFSLSYSGSWTDPAVKSPPLGPNESYLPAAGDTLNLTLPTAANYQYVGPAENLTTDELKGNSTLPQNWEGSNVSRFDVGDFSAASMPSIHNGAALGTMIVSAIVPAVVLFLC